LKYLPSYEDKNGGDQIDKKEQERKIWVQAATWYQQALYLVPDMGHAHNQLAVLAADPDYGDTFYAVFHYFRALMVSQPFTRAKENLCALLHLNMNKFRKNSIPPLPTTPKSVSQEIIKQHVKTFCELFVRLHGILITHQKYDYQNQITF
jgi:protein SMG7